MLTTSLRFVLKKKTAEEAGLDSAVLNVVTCSYDLLEHHPQLTSTQTCTKIAGQDQSSIAPSCGKKETLTPLPR